MAVSVAENEVREKPSRVVLHDVTWKFYRQFLDEVGEQNIRVTYSDGVMEIMSPLPIHEKAKKGIAQMVEIITLELRIPRSSLGSTTYANDILEKGLEPDECYYFENEPRVRGKDRIDLRVDPPPDLAVEVDISYRSAMRQSIYAAMGVPELWRSDGTKIECLILNDSGVYDSAEYSRALPMIRVSDLERYLARLKTENETAVMHAFREWVRALPV